MGVLHKLQGRTAEVGGAQVQRVLPKAVCRKVGPWVFLDHFGPTQITASRAMDVRPHPHCGLSTVSYLFEGAIVHRDSLGSHVRVGPGEMHWMRAGHGIVHSERTPPEVIGQTVRSHGLQLWCAHPDGDEEQAPAFGSWTSLPDIEVDGVPIRILAGHGWGTASPVDVTSNLVYALVELAAGQQVTLPDHAERAVYPVHGAVQVDGETASAHQMLVVDREAATVSAVADTTLVVLGGDPIGHRYMWWNLVHSDYGRLQEQAQRWRDGGFPIIEGDSEEFIAAPPGPLPQRR